MSVNLPDRFVLFYQGGKPKRFTRILPNQWQVEEWENKWNHFSFCCDRYAGEGFSKADCYAAWPVDTESSAGVKANGN